MMVKRGRMIAHKQKEGFGKICDTISETMLVVRSLSRAMNLIFI
jgi:hypothetical protein